VNASRESYHASFRRLSVEGRTVLHLQMVADEVVGGELFSSENNSATLRVKSLPHTLDTGYEIVYFIKPHASQESFF
jgi:hypothetical protein